MILLVSYKLTPGKDYTNLYNAIQAAPTTSWWHYIDDTWLVATPETPTQLHNRLSPFLQQGSDTLLIMKVDPAAYEGWLPRQAHHWINTHSANSGNS